MLDPERVKANVQYAVTKVSENGDATPGDELIFNGLPKSAVWVDPDAKNLALRRRMKATREKHRVLKLEREKHKKPGWKGGLQLGYAEGMAAFAAMEAGELAECPFKVDLDDSLWTWGLRDHGQNIPH